MLTRAKESALVPESSVKSSLGVVFNILRVWSGKAHVWWACFWGKSSFFQLAIFRIEPPGY